MLFCPSIASLEDGSMSRNEPVSVLLQLSNKVYLFVSTRYTDSSDKIGMPLLYDGVTDISQPVIWLND